MILALQTADSTTHLWLFDQPGAAKPIAHEDWDSGRALSEQLLGRLTTFVRQHGRLEDLAGIIIFSGPGSFTSLRIGHTVANALADGLGIPAAGATGDDWLAVATKRLAGTPTGRPALPHYGADAHITKPKS